MTNIAYEKESSYLEGKDDGIKQGIEQGIVQGIEQGIEQNKREMAKAMLLKGLPLIDIVSISGLSEKEIRSL